VTRALLELDLYGEVSDEVAEDLCELLRGVEWLRFVDS
jgi:hypothetical protein